MQFADAADPVRAEKVPPAQLEQAVDIVASEYEPAVQAAHTIAPAAE